ncbi:secretin receptor-like [Littorina saxatilis]|uniref:secretin receptor-like n=1 Tax=Littorina saxatilis TaxID=31220 RepID=UPI0038B45DFD
MSDEVEVVKLMDKKEQIQRLTEARTACWVHARQYFNRSQFPDPDAVTCPVAWDNILCWSEAPPGTIQNQPCPDYIHGFDTHQNATRECTEDGTWFFNDHVNKTWTNYNACYSIITPHIKDIQEFVEHADSLKLLYTVGYGVSLGSLIIAVFIMCCCSRLKSKSNTLHLNLFLAFILRAALSFAKQLLFVEDLGLEKDIRRRYDGRLEFIQDGTHWECRTLVSLFIYSICVSQMWIFMEGLYLHMLIYSTLSTERRGVRVYVLLGWLSPLLFFIPWVVAKSTLDSQFCWTIHSKPALLWIFNGPLMASVIVNFVFFLNILRVLVSRVRSADRHIGRQQQYRRLAKFILVLIPLFGVLYIVFYVIFPVSFSAEFDIRHLYMEMTYNSFQGFILALLFCFLNEEVHAEIRRMWMRKKSLRRDSMALTRSFGLSSFRKPSFRGHNSVIVRGGGGLTNNNLPGQQSERLYHGRDHTLRVTRSSSADSSGSDKAAADWQWLLKIKRRAALVVFWRKKSSESREGVIDERYDCDIVPDIDAHTTFAACNGSNRRRMLDDEEEPDHISQGSNSGSNSSSNGAEGPLPPPQSSSIQELNGCPPKS